MRCIDKDGDDNTTVEEFMSFVIVITNPLWVSSFVCSLSYSLLSCRKRGVLNEENIAWLEQVFRENVGKGKEEFTLDEFKKIVPSKNVWPAPHPSYWYLTLHISGIFCWKGIQNIWQRWKWNRIAGGVYRDNAPIFRARRRRENLFSFQSLWPKLTLNELKS